MKNKIPDILHERRMNITDFHTLLKASPETKISYPTAHKLATEEFISDQKLYTLAKVAVGLKLTLDDLVEVSLEN